MSVYTKDNHKIILNSPHILAVYCNRMIVLILLIYSISAKSFSLVTSTMYREPFTHIIIHVPANKAEQERFGTWWLEPARWLNWTVADCSSLHDSWVQFNKAIWNQVLFWSFIETSAKGSTQWNGVHQSVDAERCLHSLQKRVRFCKRPFLMRARYVYDRAGTTAGATVLLQFFYCCKYILSPVQVWSSNSEKTPQKKKRKR